MGGGLQGWGVGAEKVDEVSLGWIGWNGRKSTGEGGTETQDEKDASQPWKAQCRHH